MAVAKALGARRVIAVDINQERLDFAKSYAATDIYIPVCLSLLSLVSSPDLNLPRNLILGDPPRYTITRLTTRAPRKEMKIPTHTVPESLPNYAVTSISQQWVLELSI